MGIVSGIMSGVGSVCKVGAGIAKTVFSAGSGIFGTIKNIFKSKVGKVVTGAGLGFLLLNGAKGAVEGSKDGVETTVPTNSEQNGFGGFLSSAKASVENAIGGISGLFKGLVNRLTGNKENQTQGSLESSVEKNVTAQPEYGPTTVGQLGATNSGIQTESHEEKQEQQQEGPDM